MKLSAWISCRVVADPPTEANVREMVAELRSITPRVAFEYRPGRFSPNSEYVVLYDGGIIEGSNIASNVWGVASFVVKFRFREDFALLHLMPFQIVDDNQTVFFYRTTVSLYD